MIEFVLGIAAVVVGGVAADLAHRRRARRYQLNQIGRNDAES